MCTVLKFWSREISLCYELLTYTWNTKVITDKYLLILTHCSLMDVDSLFVLLFIFWPNFHRRKPALIDGILFNTSATCLNEPNWCNICVKKIFLDSRDFCPLIFSSLVWVLLLGWIFFGNARHIDSLFHMQLNYSWLWSSHRNFIHFRTCSFDYSLRFTLLIKKMNMYGRKCFLGYLLVWEWSLFRRNWQLPYSRRQALLFLLKFLSPQAVV